MALNINDYFDENEAEEAAEATHEEEATGEAPQQQPDNEEETYRKDFIVTNSQRRRKRFRRIAVIAVVVVVLAILVNVLFISKKVEKGCIRGYLVKMELCDGILFDSYECTMVADYPDRVVDPKELIFKFSVRDNALGKRIHNAMKGDSLLLVDYVQYSMKMPWRGNTDVLVDSAIVVSAKPVLRSPAQVVADKAAAKKEP